ncbi:unnamed protein product, partial [Allacma fusca]
LFYKHIRTHVAFAILTGYTIEIGWS